MKDLQSSQVAAADASALAWLLPSMAPGALADLSYQVTVKPAMEDASYTGSVRVYTANGELYTTLTTQAITLLQTVEKLYLPQINMIP